MFYRFETNGLGIYEAVDFCCPREDQRRQNKPDGSWLPKVGEKYPGAVSFWTQFGLEKYLESGLQEWHRSVLMGALSVRVCESLDQVLYQDPYQVIVSKTNFSQGLVHVWPLFVQNVLKAPIKEKVVAYIVRENDKQKEILVFEHDKQWSEAGLQVPAGSPEPGESLTEALLREVLEESGVKWPKVLEKIDEYVLYRQSHKEFNRRHIYVLKPSSALPVKWSHQVQGKGEDKEMNFHFTWLEVKKAQGILAGSLGSSINKLKSSHF